MPACRSDVERPYMSTQAPTSKEQTFQASRLCLLTYLQSLAAAEALPVTRRHGQSRS